MAVAVGTQVGRYEVSAPVGAGAMGAVYRARDTRLRREVALKVLPTDVGDPERLRRFEREARALAALNHPNVLAVFELTEHEGHPVIVTELLEGTTLGQVLQAAPLPISRVLELIIQLARGLAAAHAKGIVHRDLKPSNVFVTTAGQVKILDFGLSRIAADEGTSDAELRTVSGTLLGTPGYMSPEQIHGAPADARSDLFAFGTVLFEALTASRPFGGATELERAVAVLNDRPVAPSRLRADVPVELDRIVLRCLEKEPDNRFQSAADLVFALEAIAAQQPRGPWSLRWGRWRPRFAAFLVLVALALAVAWASAHADLSRLAARSPSPSYTRLTYRPGTVTAARFVQAGNAVLFSAAFDGALERLYLAVPGKPDVRPLTEAGLGLAAVSPTSDVAVFVRRGDSMLSSTPMLGRTNLAGSAIREEHERVVSADFDSRGALLLVRRNIGTKNPNCMTVEYPPGRVRYESKVAQLRHCRLSPDSRTVACAEYLSDEGRVLLIAEDGSTRSLGSPKDGFDGLAWEANGKALWISGGAAQARGIYRLTLDGREERVVTGPGKLTVVDVAADGRLLVVASNERRRTWIGKDDEEAEVINHSFSTLGALSSTPRALVFNDVHGVYVASEGRPPVRLGDGLGLAISADARYVLVGNLPMTTQLMVTPVGAGTATPLDLGRISLVIRAFFMYGHSGALVVGYDRATNKPHLWVLEPGREARPISPEGMKPSVSVTGPSPDGRWAAAWNIDGALVLLPIAGGAPVELGRSLLPMGWSADGQLFVREQANLFERFARIDRLDIATRLRKPWRTFTPRDRVGLVSLGLGDAGLMVTEDGTYAYDATYRLSDLYVVDLAGKK